VILCFSDLGMLKRVTGVPCQKSILDCGIEDRAQVCATSRTVPGERVCERSVTHACTSDVRTAESLLPPSRVPAMWLSIMDLTRVAVVER
jgi:hypothetical protein